MTRSGGLSKGFVLVLAMCFLAVEPVAQAAGVGAEIWVKRDARPAKSFATFLAVSPDGSTVYVAGSVRGVNDRSDYGVAAYRAGTGEKVWAARYDGAQDYATSIAVSRDGSKVFVTGSSGRPTSLGTLANDFATVAYRASTGAQIWGARFDGPARGPDGGRDEAYSLAASPDGSTLFVTGRSEGIDSGRADVATVAYRASTGAQIWVSRYDGTASGFDAGYNLAVSPDGSRVFVDGASKGMGGSYYDIVTFAYRASSGARVWTRRYDGPASGYDSPNAIGVSPDGSKVFVAGASKKGNGNGTADFITIAYRARRGARVWAKRYDGPAGSRDSVRNLAVGPGVVYVTGPSTGNASYGATVAYKASTGKRIWGHRQESACNLAVSPDSSKVFVIFSDAGVGTAFDFITLAWKASTGVKVWGRRYDGPASGDDDACAIAASRNGSKVFVNGTSDDKNNRIHLATVAYKA